jgi:hypothetical protein
VAALGGIVNQTATAAADNVGLEFLVGFSDLINQFSQDTVDLLVAMAEIPQKLVTWWKGAAKSPPPTAQSSNWSCGWVCSPCFISPN